MKKILLLGVVLCTLLAAQAQRVYFVYLQTDNKSPFYAKTGDRVYSSSAEGYLIIPKLVDSTYALVIGKPGQQALESRFSITINNNDRGFLIRQVENKLSLFDFLSMAVIEPSAAPESAVSYMRKTDGFTTLLSQAADDTSLLNVPILAKAEKAKKNEVVTKPAPVSTQPVVTTPVTDALVDNTAISATNNTTASVQAETTAMDTTASTVAKEQKEKPETNTQADSTATVQTPVAQPATASPAQTITEEKTEQTVFKKSVVTRRSESSTSEGFGLVFLDAVEGATDTIRILIPNPRVIKETIEEQPAERAAAVQAETNSTTNTTVAIDKPVEQKAPVTRTKAACNSTASENDFFKLRRSMTAKNSEEEMINEARKSFKNKCFTTLQIKHLSSLFLTSNGKYNFFEAAYASVADKEQFPALQTELWQDEHINRFKALVSPQL